MFEKESEEYTENQKILSGERLVRKTFKDGAEFGYNKCLEEATQKYKAIIADYDKQISELKSDNDARKFAMAMNEKVEKQLREENAELKKENIALRQDWDVMKSTITDYNNLLTKAKEIIREYIRLSLQEDKDIDANVKLFQKAEAFLNSEVEK